MNIALWIAAALLALAFLATGLLKITQSKEKLAAAGMGWTESFSPAAIKAIGVAEVLGAIGLILPAVLDIAPFLVPIAAVGLALVMVGAITTHVRRKETPMVVLNVVLLALALFVAWGRFGAYAF
ncbi:DoxX family protein [Cellulomonas sp. P5_C5]